MEHWWFQEADFKQAWQDEWQLNVNAEWHVKWNGLLNSIKGWALNKITPKKKLDEIQKQIYTVQMQHPSVRDHAKEEQLLGEFNKVQDQLDLYWNQRSRVQWMNLGDRNTNFFHTVATNRRRRNSIKAIRDEDGNYTGDEKKIRLQFVQYFSDLYGHKTANRADQPATHIESEEKIANFFQGLEGDMGCCIPNEAHHNLLVLPDFQEVKRAMFQMGPDKSPGPDGVTPRFLQNYWHIIGPDVVQQIREIFHTGHIPDGWLKCKVVLIPKGEEPDTPSKFRPISIGNVLYRLVMKILTNRLRPHMKRIISQEQTAFLQNRCISDNVLIIKEILNSFNDKRYKQAAFMLKADITKAFDKLSWNFLEKTCEWVNMPNKITRMLISAYQRAQVSIHINGSGDGYITPERGLRQGCPMSPYAFIMVMEMLTRKLKKALHQNILEGVKLAPSAQTLTHMIYADDLVLLGQAKETEVSELRCILHEFGEVSGLVVNPNKSKLWFTKATANEKQAQVQHSLQATQAEPGEKYLGMCLSGRQSAKRTGQMLLDRMWSKLAGWKCSMLSHAGRLVLLKSVLTSLPVYYMTTVKLPKGVIDQMMSLMAKFFWGKTDKVRYLSFISWKKICSKVEDGGLGVKDLHKFGDALFMKNIWALMGQENKLWVDVCRAKYFPRIGFWGATNTRGGSQLWKEVVKNKQKLKDEVKWDIHNGHKALAVSQPWFNDWEIQHNVTLADRQLTVSQLFDTDRNQWREDQLERIFGVQGASQIYNTASKPNPVSNLEDKLIWQRVKEGRYTVKEGYKWLEGSSGTTGQNQMIGKHWKIIAELKNVAPKVKVFLWRLLSKTLPIDQNLNRRISAISPMCQRCHEENEFETHCLFFCPGSRAVWFGGQLMLRVHELPLDIVEAFNQITERLDQQGMEILAYTLWELWKGRNEVVMKHKQFDPFLIKKNVAAWLVQGRQDTQGMQIISQLEEHRRYEVDENEWQVLIDGSWEPSGKTGTAAVIYQNGEAKFFAYQFREAQDPFHAEALACLDAVGYIKSLLVRGQVQKICIHSDSSKLVDAIKEEQWDNLPS
ncbi:reverse transcriptase [Rhynchospora pubera]|uniref:Reverse transcriptase n=1 Tax=Rhynchospora pubera TaxID=906938 RepID=A0AAV8EDW9_9POAL|nr:reverse transcriptase [Rhynchospora pubera]